MFFHSYHSVALSSLGIETVCLSSRIYESYVHQVDSPADAVEEIQQPPSAPTPRILKVNTQFDPMHQGLPGLQAFCSHSHWKSQIYFYPASVSLPAQPLHWARWPKYISSTAHCAVATFSSCTKPRVAVTIAVRPASLATSKVRCICIPL